VRGGRPLRAGRPGALQRVGDRRLGTAATTTSADVVDQILGVGPVRGTTLLGDEPLTPMAVDLLDGQGATVAIAAADTDAQDAGTGEPATADVTARRLPQVVLAPFDPAVGAALAAVGTTP
jgi:hypothetical protein